VPLPPPFFLFPRCSQPWHPPPPPLPFPPPFSPPSPLAGPATLYIYRQNISACFCVYIHIQYLSLVVEYLSLVVGTRTSQSISTNSQPSLLLLLSFFFPRFFPPSLVHQRAFCVAICALVPVKQILLYQSSKYTA
jgi:hypothetical protein